jgi:hypothetical protein
VGGVVWAVVESSMGVWLLRRGGAGSGVRVGERMIVLSPQRAAALYWFSFSFFSIALIALPISWTCDESMANKLLMR